MALTGKHVARLGFFGLLVWILAAQDVLKVLEDDEAIEDAEVHQKFYKIRQYGSILATAPVLAQDTQGFPALTLDAAEDIDILTLRPSSMMSLLQSIVSQALSGGISRSRVHLSTLWAYMQGVFRSWRVQSRFRAFILMATSLIRCSTRRKKWIARGQGPTGSLLQIGCP